MPSNTPIPYPQECYELQEELESISEELRIPGSKPLGPISKARADFLCSSSRKYADKLALYSKLKKGNLHRSFWASQILYMTEGHSTEYKCDIHPAECEESFQPPWQQQSKAGNFLQPFQEGKFLRCLATSLAPEVLQADVELVSFILHNSYAVVNKQ